MRHNEFATLMGSACLIATDYGVIQEETTALGIPRLRSRERTERPITLTEGTNTIVGTVRVAPEANQIIVGQGKRGGPPPCRDGHGALRIVDALERSLADSPPPRTAEPIA
jgi:UDP-N-acetylglucosamine 2-epimerase (non-hydrolysing)